MTLGASRVFVASLPPKVVTLPRHRRRPHAACHRMNHASCDVAHGNLQTGSTAAAVLNPSALSFPLGPGHHSRTRTGRDCLAARELPTWYVGVRVQPFGWITACAPARFLLRPLSPPPADTARRQMPSNQPDRREAKLSDAAVVPALASTFDFEFTLLGRVTVRSAQVCAPFRQATLSRRIAPGNHTEFPLTKAEAESTAPERTFAIRHRLLETLLASSFVRIRLSLSWLSFSPPGV